MKKIRYLVLIGFLGLVLFGCSDFREFHIQDALTRPWDTKPPLNVGMTKEEVRSEWDEPDIINQLPATTWGTDKEEWIYWGRYPNVPIDYMYLSQTKHLIFEGNILVDFFDAEEIRKK